MLMNKRNSNNKARINNNKELSKHIDLGSSQGAAISNNSNYYS